ncbi:MAG: indolepyruvate oxidoreductase subunit beta [Firmicutes bacterium ADurb.Bin182]|nr:MAG: indolepyruvate oxidoreductase subunit beta [Firmicutes bacterium ADurb.Bin182]
MNKLDIYFVSVGGQGALTVCAVIAEAAADFGVPVVHVATKGMAQRGGAVCEQMRIGREDVSPVISPGKADMAVSMEISESFKAIRFLKPGGTFVLLPLIWRPAAVMLGKAAYPALEELREEAEKNRIKLLVLNPSLPLFGAKPVKENIYLLGALSSTELGSIIPAESLRNCIRRKWPKAEDANMFAFNEGAAAL